MKKILLATSNPGKLQELTKGFRSVIKNDIQFLTLNDVGVEEKPEENGKTFCSNAETKAKYYAKRSHLTSVGDDGGLIIPYLNNNPGVRSRRWPGYEATDEELINYTIAQLKGIKGVDRTAYLTICLCLFNPQTKQIFYTEEQVKGRISEKPSHKRIEGYPFRALFIVDMFNKYYDELTDKEHEMVNHRLKASIKMAKKIKDLLK